MDEMQVLLDALYEVDEDIDFEHETDLVDDGVVDSLQLTQIIAALDDAFDIQISTADIEPENFNSAASMLELVRRYQG